MAGYFIKRILKSRLYFLCLFLSIIILIMGSYSTLLTAGTRGEGEKLPVLECLVMALDMGGFFAVFAPALMSVVFLFFFTQDLEKRGVYYQLLRTNRRQFYFGQIISGLVTAALMVLVSLVVFTVVCFACGAVWEFDGQWFTLFEGLEIAPYYYGENSWKMTLWHMILVVLYCLPWFLFGMVVSLFTKNRYIILASPFVIFMLWNYVSQWIYRSYPAILWFEPVQPLLIWGIPWEHEWSLKLTFLYPVVYHVVLIGGLSLLYLWITRRRYRREGL